MRHKIIKESTTLFFRYGIKSITMDDIAKELGISKKTLYQHFENKNDLLMACIEWHDTEEKVILKSFQLEATNAIDEMIRIAKYIQRMLERTSPTLIYDIQKYHREAWDKMHKVRFEDITKEIETNIIRGINEGLYRSDINIDLTTKFYVNNSFACTNPDIFPNDQYKINDLVKNHILNYLHSIVSSKGLALLELMKEELK